MENDIIAAFTAQFPWLQDRMYATRPGRIFTKALTCDEFEPLIRYAKDAAGFTIMHHVVGTDDGDVLGFLYIMSNEDGVMLALRETAPKDDPKINSMMPLFPSLQWHERELVDLYGADVQGLPDGPNYPLPDGWPKGSYPMRKDWELKYFDRDTMTYNKPEEAGQ